MKQLFIICTFLFTVSTAMSQEFVSESRQWNVQVLFWGDVFTEVYKIEGDSVYEALGYKKVWRTGDSLLQNWNFYGLIREDSGIVYFRLMSWEMQEEGILYDFNIGVGETVEVISASCPYPQELTVVDIDTVTHFDIQRRRWIFNAYFEETWIEGIGDNLGPFHARYYNCIADIDYNLLCYYEEDSLRYIKEEEDECFQFYVGMEEINTRETIRVYPNPASQYIRLISQERLKDCKLKIFDVRGRSVLEDRCHSKENEFNITGLPAGVYFIGFDDRNIKPVKFLKY